MVSSVPGGAARLGWKKKPAVDARLADKLNRAGARALDASGYTEGILNWRSSLGKKKGVAAPSERDLKEVQRAGKKSPVVGGGTVVEGIPKGEVAPKGVVK